MTPRMLFRKLPAHLLMRQARVVSAMVVTLPVTFWTFDWIDQIKDARERRASYARRLYGALGAHRVARMEMTVDWLFKEMRVAFLIVRHIKFGDQADEFACVQAHMSPALLLGALAWSLSSSGVDVDGPRRRILQMCESTTSDFWTRGIPRDIWKQMRESNPNLERELLMCLPELLTQWAWCGNNKILGRKMAPLRRFFREICESEALLRLVRGE